MTLGQEGTQAGVEEGFHRKSLQVEAARDSPVGLSFSKTYFLLLPAISSQALNPEQPIKQILPSAFSLKHGTVDYSLFIF